MEIVILDGHTVNPGDLDWTVIESKGTVRRFDRTASDQIVERVGDAEVLIVNKVRILEEHLSKCPKVKAICLLATGYDNVDIASAKEHGVKVFNAVGYGSESVAQHTLAMMLAYSNRIESHHQSVQKGDWSAQKDFSYSLNTVSELSGKKLGVIGYGKIGRRVADLARTFGMEILTIKRSTEKEGARTVSKEVLFGESHFITLHAPLNDATKEIIDKESLAMMRSDAVIINTGRGGLINEDDLAEAILSKKIGGAVLDVLSIEPPQASHRLLHLQNVMITPHMAWRSKEARARLMQIVSDNIDHYRKGVDTNRVV